MASSPSAGMSTKVATSVPTRLPAVESAKSPPETVDAGEPHCERRDRREEQRRRPEEHGRGEERARRPAAGRGAQGHHRLPAEQRRRALAECGEQEQPSERRELRPAVGVSTADDITARHRRQEDTDDRSPDVDAVAEGRREQAARDDLERHQDGRRQHDDRQKAQAIARAAGHRSALAGSPRRRAPPRSPRAPGTSADRAPRRQPSPRAAAMAAPAAARPSPSAGEEPTDSAPPSRPLAP